MRHIILHHHIFKNAGSTLDFSLARQFPGRFTHLEDGDSPIVPAVLLDFLDRNPLIKAISSHNFGGQLFHPHLFDRKLLASHYALIRRPCDRLISIYKYFRRLGPSNDLASVAAELSFGQFVELLVERYPHMIDSPQVTSLANDGFYARPVNDNDLDRACTRYQMFALCAPVERYDEAMVTLEYYNAPNYFPDVLDLSYVRQNVSAFIAGEEDQPNLLGSTLNRAVVRFSERDERLWQFANAELDRRIDLVPQFKARLAFFRKRCEQIAFEFNSN